MKEAVHKLAKKYSDTVPTFFFDYDKDKKVMRYFRIKSVPSYVLFKKGQWEEVGKDPDKLEKITGVDMKRMIENYQKLLSDASASSTPLDTQADVLT